MAKRKQKSQLRKLIESCDDCLYETTESDCRLWFNILNKELFDNKLSPVDDIDIRWRRGTYAFYECITDTQKQTYLRTKLCMNKRYKSKKFFVEVLSHELIHHYQALYNEPLGHGPSFLMWREKFNGKGLNLVKVYG